MIIVLSILTDGKAIADSWPPVVTFLFGILMFAVMAYFWYSCSLSIARARRGNFYIVSKKDLAPQVTSEQAERVIGALQTEVQRRQPVTGETIQLGERV